MIVLLASCTKANPAAKCTKGSCSDPNYPYCDADGSIGGVPGTCIAVTCTAGTFKACSADGTALTCNDSGTGYTQVECAHGCDEASGGCRLCEPNQTVCENGEVASCDASGAQTSMSSCPLGCFEDQPRCRDIDPSNRLGTYMDMVPSPADLDLSTGSWVINVSTGMITGPATASAQSFVAPSATGGPSIRVFVVNKLQLGNVSIYGDDNSPMAVAFLASSDIEISGTVTVADSVGGSADPSCSGKPGYLGSIDGYCAGTPGGGGGAATAGASSGYVDAGSGTQHGYAGGVAHGTDSLEPLVGGCGGGGFDNPTTMDNIAVPGPGGGAIQLSSRTAISVSGSIIADGADGSAGGASGPCGGSVYGGAGGGGILLEAPSVTLASGATLSALGGKGGAYCQVASAYCALGGDGGTPSSAPSPGGNVTFTTGAPANTEFWAGGGGGGVGRIRINTPNGNYTLDSNATEAAIVTTGLLNTR